MPNAEEEFSRSEEAFDAISNALDDGEFMYGDIMIAIGTIVAEMIKDGEIDPSEMFEILQDVTLAHLKHIADA